MDITVYQRFDCPLDENICVLCLDPDKDEFKLPENSRWHFEMSMFETSHAFAVWEDVPQPLILLDKRLFVEDWFTADHLFAVLAHEMGHIHLKSIDEALCDKFAIELLEGLGLEEARKMIENR